MKQPTMTDYHNVNSLVCRSGSLSNIVLCNQAMVFCDHFLLKVKLSFCKLFAAKYHPMVPNFRLKILWWPYISHTEPVDFIYIYNIINELIFINATENCVLHSTKKIT